MFWLGVKFSSPANINSIVTTYFYFGWGDKKLNIIHSRLRNMCSSLNADLHLVNLKPGPACICGHGFEDCIHFLIKELRSYN
jgi:hypothetical protein